MPLPPSVRLGAEGRKLDPKLRMVRNGSSTVNAVRAEQCAAVSLAPDSPLLQEVPLQRDEAARTLTKAELPAAAVRKPLTAVAADVLANVFITTTDPGEETIGFPGETMRRGNI